MADTTEERKAKIKALLLEAMGEIRKGDPMTPQEQTEAAEAIDVVAGYGVRIFDILLGKGEPDVG